MLASVFTLLAFSLDLALNRKANDAAVKTRGVITVTYGNTVWMVLAAWILQWVAKIASCVAAVRERRRVKRAAKGRY